jgi:hypothetical protein
MVMVSGWWIETMKFFIACLAFILFVPLAARGIAIDAKLDPEPGEDETRLLEPCEDGPRRSRSFYRRWLRAANYQTENIERALTGKIVDNCPRLTRAKRNMRRTVTEDRAPAIERMRAWRENDDNRRSENGHQVARHKANADDDYLANVTIDDIECERPIIAVDSEGMDGGPETVISRNGVNWPDHYSILWGAGGVGFTKAGMFLELPTMWLGREDKSPRGGIEIAEFLLSLGEHYGGRCSFVAFSFNYDVTMLLKGLRQDRANYWHFAKVWEICKRRDKTTKIVRNTTIHIGRFSISYIKSKVLIIKELVARITYCGVSRFTTFLVSISSLSSRWSRRLCRLVWRQRRRSNGCG